MNEKMDPQDKINVAILDDHQSMLDGYAFRLSQYPNIDLVATARFAGQLPELLAANPVDVLILDVSVPVSEEDLAPFPIFHTIPELIDKNPGLNILVISMHKQNTLIRAAMDAGARGYILKDDRKSILKLGEIIQTVASGGVYFSEGAYAMSAGNGTTSSQAAILTPRQREALSLSAASPEMSSAELAAKLKIAPSTLRTLLSDAYARLEVPNRGAAVARARQLGLITPYPPSPDA